MYIIKTHVQYHMESALYSIYAQVVLYHKSYSFAALIRLISDTSTTRGWIPFASTFHEVFSISDNPTWYFDGSFFGILCSTGNSRIKYLVTRLGVLN